MFRELVQECFRAIGETKEAEALSKRADDHSASSGGRRGMVQYAVYHHHTRAADAWFKHLDHNNEKVRARAKREQWRHRQAADRAKKLVPRRDRMMTTLSLAGKLKR